MFLVHIFEKPFAGPISFHKKENCPGVFSMYVYRELFIMEMFLHSREFSLVLDILFSFHNWGQRR